MKALRIVLTGATGGIGRAIAHSLAGEGHRLILLGRHREALVLLRTSLERPEQHGIYEIDLSDPGAVAAMCEELSSWGVDALINNAGASQFALLADSDDPAAMMAVNLLAPIRVTQGLLPALLRSKQGCVINIGSTFGSIGYPGFSLYCASKFGLRGFTEALQRELADQAIAVHYLAPRAVATEMNSEAVVNLNRDLGNAVDSPEVVAEAVRSLLNKRQGARRYLGWPESLFVRLNHIVPSVVAKALRKQLPTIRRYAHVASEASVESQP